ncbi:MAG: hypothetical protein GF307_08920 [candidate division Zixibacteria bacterium]|nr:hypothetical protein [candidate division Zixibacteria bacterium]
MIIAYILIIIAGGILLYMAFRTGDRRYIYFAVAFYVVFPVLVHLPLPTSISPEARQLYDAVDGLPDSSTVMLTFDYYPSTLAETEPMSRAALHHLFKKDCRVLTMTTIPLGGPSIAERVTREVAEKYGKVYGKDFVNLGYKANYVAVLKGMGSSIETIYPTDNSGTPLSEIPMMKDIKNYEGIDFIIAVADNAIIDYWISIVNSQYGVPVGTGVTAVMAPRYFAYIGAGQMTGMLGGMKGAAEYELLVNEAGTATKGMTAQSLVHLFIIVSVAVGNVIHFMERRGRRRRIGV